LLMIDDYDISHSQSYSLSDILPTRSVGHVLVTTRNPCASQHNPIHVPENIGKDDSIELLKRLAKLDGLFIHSIDIYIIIPAIADNIR
jgi:hypothetical protein